MNQSNKMTYQEIIEILKQSFEKVDDFAYDQIPENLPYSKEALEASIKKKEWLNNNPQPKSSDRETYNSWYEEYRLIPDNYEVSNKEWKQKYPTLEWKEVDHYGGEGQGETWYSVKHFPHHNIYIRVDGFYTSYNGTDFDDGWNCCSEVTPQQRTITVYE